MSSRVWLSLSPEAREQYRNWFGSVDVDYTEAPRNDHSQELVSRKPLRRRMQHQA